MELFVEVVRQNSFKRAAEVLGVPISTLSRRLSSLERDLGVRLLRENHSSARGDRDEALLTLNDVDL
ncbi:LysR family transcriptional regulator [Pseudomonas aeruginosa]|nr:LysR family transcriptional regulator [Pseudomonas aeruginosa]